MPSTEAKRRYKLANREKILAKGRAYAKRCYAADPELFRARCRKYYADNKVIQLERARKLREANPEYHAEYRQANKEECNARIRRWQKQNPERVKATGAKYRASKFNAAPKWLTDKDWDNIKLVYAEATRLTQLTGISFEVDHIIPLQGENVCGLHVPCNLAILSRTENASKGNKHV